MKKRKNFSRDLSKALAQLQRAYGDDIFNISTNVEVIPTGILSLDRAVGIGGIPVGRITELSGAESSGKTTLSLHIISEAQKIGKKCAFIDVEASFDKLYAKRIGVSVDDLLVVWPEYGEQALNILSTLTDAGVDLVVLDSVAALIPQSEIDSDFDSEGRVASQAKLVTRAMKSINPKLIRNNVAVVLVNQVREKFATFGFGVKEVTPGGRALKHFCSLRLNLRFIGKITQGANKEIGTKIKIVVEKNKLNRPYVTAIVPTRYNYGFDTVGDLVDIAVENGIIKKSGVWYKWKKIRTHGREEFINKIRRIKKARDVLYNEIVVHENGARK